MQNRAKVLFVIVAMIIATSGFALEPYVQDFEGMSQADPSALSNDGWLVYGNVFGPDWSWWYGYGAFPAPNGTGAFCDVATDGTNQFLNIYSDYQNANHGDGTNAIIESNVFNEMVVGPGDVGETWVFEFDAMLGNLAGATTANAFIKTLDPANGYATTNYITLDMTSIPAAWSMYSITLVIDGTLDGQILQIGYNNYCSNYEGSGVYYDNINFSPSGPVATEEMSFGNVKSLYR